MSGLFQSSCPCCGRPYETDVAVSGFDEFWSAHPGARQNKKAAQDKFSRAVKSGSKPADIVNAARAYADHCQRVNKPPRLPVTWLNQRGWEDDHEQTQLKAIEGGQHGPRDHRSASEGRENQPDAALDNIARLAGLGSASRNGRG